MRKPVRLFGPATVSNAAATKLTVAAGTINVIRQLHISNPTASAVTFTFSIGADAAGTRLMDAFNIPAGTVYDHFCYYPMVAAEIFQAFASVNAVLTLTGSGEEITLG